MCKPGNQTIKQRCRHAIIKQMKKLNPSNQEMQAVLQQNQGCMEAKGKRFKDGGTITVHSST